MHKWLGIGIFLAVAVIVSVVPAPAQEEAIERANICKVMGCRDPFVSLIRPTPVDEGVDISQMSVVAIVWDAEGHYALLKFPDGKYYIYKEGMTIGIHEGKIEKILENSVLIREIKPNHKGKPESVDTYLKLRKEGQ
jgi:hypothetical protein